MYSAFRQSCERLLRIPMDPGPPPGDEATAQVFHPAPNFFKYLLVIWGLKSLAALLAAVWISVAPAIGAVALIRKGHASGWWLFLIPLFVLAAVGGMRLFALAVLRLEFEKRFYIVTNRSLRVREGIVVVREMTVTFANIQNISISQGPVQRALGIADLRVDTAGGGAVNEAKHPGTNLHTAWFRGVNNAPQVRELIQQRLRKLKDAGLGEGDQEETASGAAVGSAAGGRMLPPEFLAALREVQAEAAALRRAMERR